MSCHPHHQISPARNQGEPPKENPQGELTCRSEERQSLSKVGGEILLATSGCFCLDQGERKPWRVWCFWWSCCCWWTATIHSELCKSLVSNQAAWWERDILVQVLHSNYHYRNVFLYVLIIYIYTYIHNASMYMYNALSIYVMYVYVTVCMYNVGMYV